MINGCDRCLKLLSKMQKQKTHAFFPLQQNQKQVFVNSDNGKQEEILGKYMYYSLPKLIVKAERVKETNKLKSQVIS